MRAACRVIKTNASSVYEWRKKDKEFADAWDDAVETVGEGTEKRFYQTYCDGAQQTESAMKWYLERRRPGYRLDVDKSDNKSNVIVVDIGGIRGKKE